MLSYEITAELTKKLKNISDLAAEKRVHLATLSDKHKAAMARYARISTIGSSTRIENAVLTDPAIEWMDETLAQDGRPTAFTKEKEYIENKLSKEHERSIEEVAGCRSMLAIVYQQAEDLFPLSNATLIGLHRELMQFYPPAEPYIGKFKIVPNNVIETVKGTEIKRDVLKTANPGPITEAAMRDLVDWYNTTLPEHPWTIAVATELVFRFLAIHPFQDGNGRMGRALFALALLQSTDENLKAVVPYIAVDRHIEKTKEEYYLVLRRCSGGTFSHDHYTYKTSYFLIYMLKVLGEALKNDIDYYSHRYTAYVNLSEIPRRVLECFKEHPEMKLGLKDVVEETKHARRTAIYALNVLLREGFVQKSGRARAAKYQLTF